jgi:hypothetical protein
MVSIMGAEIVDEKNDSKIIDSDPESQQKSPGSVIMKFLPFDDVKS